MVICAGIDLAASEHRPTGIAIVNAPALPKLVFLLIKEVYKDSEIIWLVKSHGVESVAIDSPLSLPSSGQGYRKVDLEMIKSGFRVLPPGWNSMKKLTLRAIGIRKALQDMNINVVETHPLSALKSSGCRSLEELLEATGARLQSSTLSKHEKDAVIAAVVCVYCAFKLCKSICAEDGSIALLPTLCH